EGHQRQQGEGDRHLAEGGAAWPQRARQAQTGLEGSSHGEANPERGRKGGRVARGKTRAVRGGAAPRRRGGRGRADTGSSRVKGVIPGFNEWLMKPGQVRKIREDAGEPGAGAPGSPAWGNGPSAQNLAQRPGARLDEANGAADVGVVLPPRVDP